MRRSPMTWVLGCALLAGLAVPGCGGDSIDREIASQSNPPPADAPRSPAEYDAKFPVPNAGDRAKDKSKGKAVTEP